MNKIISPASSMSDPESPPHKNAPDHLTKLEIQFSVQDTFSLVSFHLVGNIIKEFGLNLSTFNWLQMFVLQLGDGLAGQADRMDLISERDRPSHVQQSDVTVQVFLPVVLGVDNDFINYHNLLNATLKPRKKWHNSNRPSNETNDN